MIRIGIGIAGLAVTGWLASQSWVGAIIMCVLLASVVLALLIMWPGRARLTESISAYSASPVYPVGPEHAATAVPAPPRASIAGPKP